MKNKLIVGFIWFLIIYVIGDWAFNIYDPLTMLSDISDISRLETTVAEDSTSHAYLFEEIDTEEFEGRITPIVGDSYRGYYRYLHHCSQNHLLII